MSMSPFAPDFPDLEFETFPIVHVPFLTGWAVGGRAGIPAILILVGFSGRMGFPLIFFKCACVVGNELMRLMPGIAFLPTSHSPSLSASHWDEGVSGETVPVEERRTPLELIDAAYKSLRQATAEDLLSMLKACSPAFFESVVVRLLMAMGYGEVAGQGTVTDKSGDGGIDGVIKQDKLGLDVVCIQAKRWDGPVGRPIIQGFVGSMDYIRARKGVILTTSTFTKDAVDFVERIEGKKVVLINGDQLADLMIDHGLGVTTNKTYEIREVSNDFFDESEG